MSTEQAARIVSMRVAVVGALAILVPAGCQGNSLEIDVLVTPTEIEYYAQDPGRSCTCSFGVLPAPGECTTNPAPPTCNCTPPPGACLSSWSLTFPGAPPLDFKVWKYPWLGLYDNANKVPWDGASIGFQGCGGAASVGIPMLVVEPPVVTNATVSGSMVHLEWQLTGAASSTMIETHDNPLVLCHVPAGTSSIDMTTPINGLVDLFALADPVSTETDIGTIRTWMANATGYVIPTAAQTQPLARAAASSRVPVGPAAWQ